MDQIPLAVLDKPLLVIVKCRCYRSSKRITFNRASLAFHLLKSKIDQSFSLSQSNYTIRYRDDENEVSDITSDSDLAEAFDYFSQGSDSSSEYSAFSSSHPNKVYMHIFVELEYDGPSLSDTYSLRSARDSIRFQSQTSLHYPKPDSDAASYMIGRPHSSVAPYFTSRTLSVLCGLMAAVQAPLVYLAIGFAKDHQGMPLVHTLFTWATLLQLFGAILAAVTPSDELPSRLFNDLPHPAVSGDATRATRVRRLLQERILFLAHHSAFIFTALGILCLTTAILSLMWVAHPLTFHSTSSRALVIALTVEFLACLGYRLYRVQQEF